MLSPAQTSPLPAMVPGGRGSLSREGRAKVRALMGPRPRAFLVQLTFAWAVIVGAIAAAESLGSLWATILAILIVATRQNVLALLVHEQVHNLGITARWGDLFVNLTAGYPLVFLTVQDYAQIHLAHHQHFFEDTDPDFRRKSGEEWAMPTTRSRLARLFLQDLLGFNVVKLYKGKRVKKGQEIKYKRPMTIPKWVHPAFLLVAMAVFAATGTLHIFLIYWLLPLLTIFQAIVRWGALCEHKYNLPQARLEEATPVITLRWWERLLLPNLNFHYHLYHHYYSNVAFGNLPTVHQLFRDEGLVREAHAYRGYSGFFRALTAPPAPGPAPEAKPQRA